MVRERVGEGRFIEVFVDTRWRFAKPAIQKAYIRKRVPVTAQLYGNRFRLRSA